MTNSDQFTDLKRLAFFEGQRLTAADLTAWWQTQRQRRWLHNQAFHMWGIAYGLVAQGDVGASTVVVEPGFGVDSRGREIVLTEAQTLTVPAVAGNRSGREAEYYLVASYREDEDQQVIERRPGVCQAEGSVRLSEVPHLEWKSRANLNEGTELLLAHAWIQNCQLSRPLAWDVRRNARPSRQPYIASGQTEAGATDWELWDIGNGPIGYSTRVDVSSARFETTPQIMARVGGSRYFSNQGESNALIITGQAAVVDVTPSSFTLQVHIDDLDQSGFVFPTQSLITIGLHWHVVWVGIEAGVGR
jgi:hypothetical protein